MKGYAEKRRLLRFEKGNVQATDRKRKKQKQRKCQAAHRKKLYNGSCLIFAPAYRRPAVLLRRKKDHRKCHTGENAILRERCFPGKTGGDQTAGEQSTFNAVEDIQKNTVQRKRKIQNGKLSEGIVPEGLFFEKNRNRAVFLRGPAVRDGQAGHQKETRKEFAGGSTECSDSGRGEACGKTEKPGKVGSAHAHELFQ